MGGWGCERLGGSEFTGLVCGGSVSLFLRFLLRVLIPVGCCYLFLRSKLPGGGLCFCMYQCASCVCGIVVLKGVECVLLQVARGSGRV